MVDLRKLLTEATESPHCRELRGLDFVVERYLDVFSFLTSVEVGCEFAFVSIVTPCMAQWEAPDNFNCLHLLGCHFVPAANGGT